LKFIYLIYLFFLLNGLFTQSVILQAVKDSNYNISKKELVNTPFGPALKSNVHYVSNNHHLNIKDDKIEIVHSKSGIVKMAFRNKPTENIIVNKSQNGWINGWITYAYCQIMDENISNQAPNYFSTTWNVPSPPLIYSDQLLYLFDGVETIQSGVAHIVQPVLQWGISPAGGGEYWSICNWYVNSNQFYYDSLIKVNPGESLQGIIQMISSSDTLFTYNSCFKGYTSGLIIRNIPQLLMPIIGFEAYNLELCNEYPNDEKIRMGNIQIKNNVGNPRVIWNSFDDINKPVMKCGQFTKIVTSSSSGGVVDIYFRPHSVGNYYEIQIYPNPVNDFLHISPNIIKSILPDTPDKVITNCKIELFDCIGRLISSSFFNILDNEFDLRMEDLNAGFYLVKFSYDNRSHTFKIIKK